jgi:hypothetical protein
VDRTSPSSLVEAVNFDAPGGKGGEEFVVTVYMVVEAMNEDQFCNWRGIRLREGLATEAEDGETQTFQVLVYSDLSPIWCVPSTSVGILGIVVSPVRGRGGKSWRTQELPVLLKSCGTFEGAEAVWVSQ